VANKEIIRLEIPSSSEYVSVARQTVGGIAHRLAFGTTDVEDVKLAVGEACTNAVKHGVRGDARVSIRCTISPRELEIEVCNAVGAEIPKPVGAEVPDPTRLDEGGLGLFLMKKLMDTVEVSCEGGFATVKMTKRISRPEPPERP